MGKILHGSLVTRKTAKTLLNNYIDFNKEQKRQKALGSTADRHWAENMKVINLYIVQELNKKQSKNNPVSG